MPSSYTRLKDDDESAGKIINAIIALIMELPCFIFLNSPNGYWIIGIIFLWFWFAATIGDILRLHTRPSAFWSKSSVSAILDTEIYWKIGPQIKAVGYAYILLIIAFFYVSGTDWGSKFIGIDDIKSTARCSQNGSKTLQKIIERHRKIEGVKQGNGVFRKLMSKGVGFLIYYESQCNIDGKSLYVKEDKNYILGLNQIDMIQYTFFLSDEKDIEKNAENQEFQLITNASDDEEEPKFQLDISNKSSQPQTIS